MEKQIVNMDIKLDELESFVNEFKKEILVKFENYVELITLMLEETNEKVC